MKLPLHPDIADGVRALRAAGLRLVTLSNGASQVAENLLGTTGVRDLFEHVLSVDDVGVWKPKRRAYEYAARVCGTEPSQMMMVAVHPWDIDGAARAGMSTVLDQPPRCDVPVVLHTAYEDHLLPGRPRDRLGRKLRRVNPETAEPGNCDG